MFAVTNDGKAAASDAPCLRLHAVPSAPAGGSGIDQKFNCRHLSPLTIRRLTCSVITFLGFWASDMPTWVPMFALPHVALEDPIDVEGVALVSMHDERIQALAKKHKRFASYLGRFRSEFGRGVQPSIIIWRDDSSDLYRSVEALAGFRDAVSISVVPYGRATLLHYGLSPEILYSDWFAIYPWMLDKNYEFVVMRTMAQMGLDEAEELQPQSTPGITPRPLIRRMIDRPMLEALLKRWPTRYQTKTPS
jgi:hypothetical protein